MIEYAAKTPTIPIPFHKLLKVVALVDGENPHVRALDIRRIVQPLPRLQLRSAGRVSGAVERPHSISYVRGP
jgi:hypothetical protein